MRTVVTWDDMASWAPWLEESTPELFNQRAINEATDTGLDFFPSDNLSWAIKLLPGGRRSNTNFLEHFQGRLASYFTHFRAYHGCRPSNITTYLERGIVPLDPSKAFDELSKHFSTGRYPEITPETLREALSSVDTSTREYRVFFEGSKKFLLKFCGHYLLYGSEYFVGILRSLRKQKDYAQILKESGTPTLLTCDVPISWLSDGALSKLSGRLIASYFKVNILRGASHPQLGEGFGIQIFRTLPPELIVSIEHPSDVRDPI